MELVFDPNDLFGEFEPGLLSGSVFELGDNAGSVTWNNCIRAAALCVAEFRGCDYDALRDHFAAYGAWDDSEIENWSDAELRAMAIQEIAADYRDQIEKGVKPDQVRHVLHDGKIHAYFGI